MRANLRWIHRALLRLLVLSILMSAALADTIYQVSPAFDNLAMRPPLSAGKTNANSGLVFDAYIAPYLTFVTNVVFDPFKVLPPQKTVSRVQTTPKTSTGGTNGYQLTVSTFGQTFSGLTPDFNFGDVITPYPGADTNVAPTIVPASGAFYVASAAKVIASDVGPVQVTWTVVSGTNRTQVTRNYLISAVPTKRPARIFWTEAPFNAPVVNLAKQFVRIHYNRSIPTPPPITTTNLVNPTNTVWLDTQNAMHGVNVSGQFILEFFKTGTMQEHIGFEVVQVQAPVVKTIVASLGERLMPVSTAYGTADLFPDIRRGFPNFVYLNAPRDGGGHFNNAVFAIKPTSRDPSSPADDPSQIEIYWKRTGFQHVLWPFEVDWYSVDWPDDRSTQHFVFDSAGAGTSVTFPTNYVVDLPWKEPVSHASLQSANVTTFTATQEGRALLQFVSGDDVWFEAVRSVANTNAFYHTPTSIPWPIGDEIRPTPIPRTLGFDGQTSALKLPTPAEGFAAAQDATIEAWVRPALGTNMNIFYLTDIATGFESHEGLGIDANGKFWHHGPAASSGANRSAASVVPGRWYHVAVQTEASGYMKLFVNGVEQGSQVPTTIGVPPLCAYSFGPGDQLNSLSRFQGEIKEIRIWKRALTGAEIQQQMYRSMTGSEVGLGSSVTGLDQQVAIDGTPQVWDAGAQTWQTWYGAMGSPLPPAMPLKLLPGFDGVTSDLSFQPLLPNTGASTDYFGATVELWIKPSVTTNASIFTLSGPGPNNVETAEQALAFDGSGHLLHISGTDQQKGTTAFIPGEWYHVAVVHGNGVNGSRDMRLFVNGVKQSADLQTSAAFVSSLTNLTYHFGLATGLRNVTNFLGEMKNIRIWNVERTQAEILANMNLDLDVTEPGLIHSFALTEMIVNQDGTLQTPDLFFGEAANWNGVIARSTTLLPLPEVEGLDLGYINPTVGTRYNPTFYSYPTNTSHIFGVNDGTLEVWWSNVDQQDFMPVGLGWPSTVQRYRNVWPLSAPQLVIAGQDTDTTGEIPDSWQNVSLYYQNDATLPGYNPNEEHGMLVSGTVYAIRDDLNTATSSRPYVLVQYLDGDNNYAPAMQLFQVVETNSVYNFASTKTVGQLLDPPMPLKNLRKASKTSFESGSAWQSPFRDKNNNAWSLSAGKDGSVTNPAPVLTGVRFYYPVQPGFNFPSLTTQPSAGTEVPWLVGTNHSALTGTPILYVFTNIWPSDVPVLHIAETLATAKRGLPSIRGQKSVTVLYDQALTLAGGSFVDSDGRPVDPARRTAAQTSQIQGNSIVKLVDYTRDQTASLAQVPSDIATTLSRGKTFFTDLPPELRSRLFFDPITHLLTLRGQFIVPDTGDSFFLVNHLSTSQRAAVSNLSTDPAWKTAIASLASQIVTIQSESDPFDSLALTTTGNPGSGFVVLAMNNSQTLTQPSDPVSVYVIRVDNSLYRGDIVPIFSENPLDEKLTMRFSADLGGAPELFDFDWRYSFLDASGDYDQNPRDQWLSFGAGTDLLSILIAGPGKLTIEDTYFSVRYRLHDGSGPTGSNWSDWTDPTLAEGWIKRALNGINPFEQRIKDLEASKVNTTVSLVSQAGARWVGDTPLNLDNINNYGLIEIYETILKRGIKLGLGYHDDGVTDALLLAAGRIHDLYMILGNEAYADALDPTIAYGTTDRWEYGFEGSSIFCFEGQVPTLLDEEFALLAGRDDTLQPSVHLYPVYNRLYWNFTKGINGGEPAYALNYNIPNADGDVSGTINESDAKAMFPQGHGDAWGHYLSAIKTYYQLLANTNFTWAPRIEATIIGGATVNIDYFDERKFAEAGVAKARTGAQIVSLTHRKLYNESQSGLWSGFRDSNTNRAWGMGEWVSRAGQGAFFDWVVGNSLLPDVSTSTNQGIQKIDRTTVPELQEIAAQLNSIQLEADHADRRLNPLGLSRDVVPFDIDPKQIDLGKSHFEQVYDRALVALNNANSVLVHAQNITQVMRRQQDSLQDFTEAINDAEQDFTNRLVAIYGYPYSDDIGPGKQYPDGYAGPDLFHFQYVDFSDLFGLTGAGPENAISITNTYITAHNLYTSGNEYAAATITTSNIAVAINLVGAGIPAKPSSYTGARHAEGQIQAAYSGYVRSWFDLHASIDALGSLQQNIQDHWNTMHARGELMDDENTFQFNTALGNAALIVAQMSAENYASGVKAALEWRIRAKELEIESIPKDLIEGLADGGDVFFDLRGSVLSEYIGDTTFFLTNTKVAEGLKYLAVAGQKILEGTVKARERNFGFGAEMLDITKEFSDLLANQSTALYEIQKRAQAMQEARGRYFQLLAEGERILSERDTFRAKAATHIQQDRYMDASFRIFRSDVLGQYRSAEDLAARYAYLAAKAYDYETGLLKQAGAGASDDFATRIARTRSLGFLRDGKPQLGGNGGGDPGLADVLAQMNANWSVLKGRFNFNNPATETSRFSLRTELLRIATPVDPIGQAQADETWRSALWSFKVDNLLALPEFQRFCIPFNPTRDVEPALVIPFSTTIQAGKNFFGQELAGGDNAYDSSHFATKIRSVGIWFSDFNNTFGGGLANQPRIYLVPVGNDLQLSNQSGDPLMWRVIDQALPLPFAIGTSDVLDKPDWSPIVDSISGGLGAIRQFSSLRAYHDKGNFDPAEVTTNSRLVGRSVWNTRWLLIIPGSTLLSDPERALEILINGQNNAGGVSDIKIFFQTYSYSGN